MDFKEYLTLGRTLTPHDVVAVTFLIVAWIGYTRFAIWNSRRVPSLQGVLDRVRATWARRMVERDNRMVDVNIVRNLTRSSQFFASTTLLATGGAAPAAVVAAGGATTAQPGDQRLRRRSRPPDPSQSADGSREWHRSVSAIVREALEAYLAGQPAPELPSFAGVGESGIEDLSERVEELLAEAARRRSQP